VRIHRKLERSAANLLPEQSLVERDGARRPRRRPPSEASEDSSGGASFPSPTEGRTRRTGHPSFRGVLDEFVRNLAERGELGASVCVIVDGHVVVDLWGGVARIDAGEPRQEDTIAHVWSCTKGATALCAHILASRGLLDLDAPVVEYWPEFGQNGKQATAVAMLMSHQAGVPAIREPLPQGAFYDHELTTGILAAEVPLWEPGTRHGYHALTFGFPVGELVRRISGRTLGEFFREEVAEPLGVDFSMGLPDRARPSLRQLARPPRSARRAGSPMRGRSRRCTTPWFRAVAPARNRSSTGRASRGCPASTRRVSTCSA